MNIVLLSGGSGTRLWPLSNSVRSKQFLKVLRDEQGKHISMVQRVVGQIERAGLADTCGPVVATGAAQACIIEAQLGNRAQVVCEPERRDTMPAILLACAYLVNECGRDPQEPVVVMPIDSYVEDDYFARLPLLERAVSAGTADIALIGIRPTYPSAKYGYIVPEPEQRGDVLAVRHFVEKPDEEQAEELIERGALWNGGVFAFRLGYALSILQGLMGIARYDEVLARYAELPRTSFDYGVVERAERVAVVPYAGAWKDLGTWNTLCEEMAEPTSGNVVLGEDCENVHVVNELQVPIVVLGLSDAVVAATHDGIIVSDKAASSHSKPYVERAQAPRPMQENRSWGRYEVLSEERYSADRSVLVKHLMVRAGKSISYQKHFKRSELWCVAEGEGVLVLDGVFSRVASGSVVDIPVGMLHGVRAVSDLHMVEVQIGSELVEEDIERFVWPDDPEVSA